MMTPSVGDGVNRERRRLISARTSPLRQTTDRAAAESDGNVVEKRGGTGAQTVRAFQGPETGPTSQIPCHRLPPVAPKVAW